jgi:hypothetical protein
MSNLRGGFLDACVWRSRGEPAARISLRRLAAAGEIGGGGKKKQPLLSGLTAVPERLVALVATEAREAALIICILAGCVSAVWWVGVAGGGEEGGEREGEQ